MALIARPNSYVAGATIIASEVNSDFDTIYNDYNGGVTNDNIASNAAIDGSKLAAASIGATLLSTGGVGSAALADDAVVAAKVADGAIGSAALAANAVVSAKIGAEAVKEAHIDYSSVQVAHCGAADMKLARGSINISVATASAVSLATATVSAAFSDAADGNPAFTNTSGPTVWIQKRVTGSSEAIAFGGFGAHETALHPLGQCVVYAKTSASFAAVVGYWLDTATGRTFTLDWLAVGV